MKTLRNFRWWASLPAIVFISIVLLLISAVGIVIEGVGLGIVFCGDYLQLWNKKPPKMVKSLFNWIERGDK